MSHKLTPKQLKALYMLTSGASANQVANTLSMQRETLSRWRKNPLFIEKFEQVMRQIEAAMQHRLLATMDNTISKMNSELSSSYGSSKHIQTASNVLKMLSLMQKYAPNTRETTPQ